MTGRGGAVSRVISLDMAHASSHYPVDERTGRLTPGFIPTQGGNPCRVPGCDRYAGTGSICRQCVESWEVCLGNVAAMVEDLTIATLKQARFGDPIRGRLVDPPLPYDQQAGYYQHRLRNELVGQIRLLCDVGHIRVPALGDDTAAMAMWLLRHPARLPYLPPDDGYGLVHDLAQMMTDCLQVIDAPRRSAYVAECCGQHVLAGDDAETATCRVCGMVYDVAETYGQRVDQARDAIVTSVEAAKSAGVTTGLIRTWVFRGQLTSHGKTLAMVERDGGVGIEQDVHLVRYGDVLDLAERKASA